MSAPIENERPAEPADASPRVIVLSAAILAAGILASLAAARLYLSTGGAGPAAPAIGAAGRFSNGPAQRTQIEETWPELDRQVRERLGRYVWVDRKAGIVRIPIEQAMKRIVAEEGRDRP